MFADVKLGLVSGCLETQGGAALVDDAADLAGSDSSRAALAFGVGEGLWLLKIDRKSVV